MTKKQFNALSKYEFIFECAVKSNYCRLSRTEFEDIMNIYYEHESYALIKVVKSAYRCSKCRLKEIINVGKSYFDYKAKNETKNTKNND